MIKTPEQQIEELEEDIQSLLDQSTSDAYRIKTVLEVLQRRGEVKQEHLEVLDNIIESWGGYPEGECGLCCQGPDLCNCEDPYYDS
jgi:hypothetical protein